MKLDRKFWDDTVWNYGSFAVVASSGLLINFLIAAQMGSEALGVFNQTYAVYVIAAQIAAMAVHDSAQKHIAEFSDDFESQKTLSAAAILHSVLTGTLAAVVVYFLSFLIEVVLQSQQTALGIAFAAPGLALFSVNKVLLGILNGQRKMRLYAIGQAMRALGILAVCLLIALENLAPSYLGLSFTITEVILLPFLLVTAAPRKTNWHFVGEMRRWTKLHFSFGSRAFVNGLLAEAYIRVDIIMLGMFLSDEQVGIYSFAAMFIEGLFQVSVVVRTIANPVLVGLLAPLNKEGLRHFVRRIAGVSFLMTGLAGGILLVVFPYFDLLFDPYLIATGYPVLTILAGGMILFAVFVPCDHILLQAGRPGAQSVMMTANILLNVVLNFTLIPLYGLTGAAIATAISFVGSGLILNLASWRMLGLKGGLLIAK